MDLTSRSQSRRIWHRITGLRLRSSERAVNDSRYTVGEMQLDEYVSRIAEVYRANDRHRSLWDVWCHALHHAAAIGERLRKRAPLDRIFDEIADFSLWLFTAVHKLSGPISDPRRQNETCPETLIRIKSGCSDLLWHRYPNVCPFCFVRRSRDGEFEQGEKLDAACDCALDAGPEPQDKYEKRAAVHRLRRHGEKMRSAKPKSIDGWQQMFRLLFRAKLAQLSLAEVMLHLMEELGEVSDAMVRMYSYTQQNFLKGEPHERQLRLESQIADVFSWLFSLVEAIDRNRHNLPEYEQVSLKSPAIGDGSIHLSEIIWARYGSDDLHSFFCPFCKDVVCSCPLIFVPATRGVEEFKSLLNNENLPLEPNGH